MANATVGVTGTNTKPKTGIFSPSLGGAHRVGGGYGIPDDLGWGRADNRGEPDGIIKYSGQNGGTGATIVRPTGEDLEKKYDWSKAALDSLATDYAYNTGVIGADRDRQLQEAYVNYMMGQRNLPQTYAANGITGGPTYTDMANRNATYQTGRNDIYNSANANLANLANEYAKNKADIASEWTKWKFQNRKALTTTDLDSVLANLTFKK